MNNKFLNDFMNMRKQMYQAPAVIPVKDTKKDSITAIPKPEQEITLAYIIEKKPPNDKVIDYLKLRAEELIAADD
jgi:hypothetical protein